MKVYLLCVAGLLLFGKRASSIPVQNFYPFGDEAGDSRLSRNDDGSSGQIVLGFAFPFFGTSYTNIYVNNNGIISFNEVIPQFTSQPFPLGDGRMIIAPYWADVDTRATGVVWYRQTMDSDLLSQARRDIRNSFISQMSFEPTMMFIATWDRVGYYNRRTDRTNTFQCILITDGTKSFVVFNYADGLIQWTTGDASGGSGGLGGTPAQVGFNAGDGIRFASVPGSQTPSIISIANTSNVGILGAWFFRVDSEEITVTDECTLGPGVPLNVGPRLGSQLGGTATYISGPCFFPDAIITCYFSEDQRRGTPGVYVNDRVALCVSPSFETPGWKPLRVGVSTDDGETEDVSAVDRFYAVPPDDTDDVQIRLEQDSLLLIEGSTDPITVMWEPPTILPTIDASMYTVDIALYRLEPVNTDGELQSEVAYEYRPFFNLALDHPNTGTARASVPSSSELVPDIYPVAVRISVGRRADLETSEEVPSIIDRVGRSSTPSASAGRVAQWTSTLYYSTSNLLVDNCLEWYTQEFQDGVVGETIRDRLPPCPPRVDQARSQNSGFKEDLGFWTILTNRFFHPEADTCFRQRNIESSHMGSGQQCCYRGNDLLVGPRSGGSGDLVAPDGFINTFRHLFVDVLPAIYCCSGSRSRFTCQLYYENRPSDDGSRYNPPPPACVYGDPHIVTLDGFKYTFNGLGEFVLIEASNDRFTLQGRMVQALNDVGTPISATVFSAIVGKELYSDTVQFQLTDDSSGVEVLMNGELVDFEGLTEQMFSNVTVTQQSSTVASAVFASGVYVEVRAANGILSTLLVSLAGSYRSQTTGLMGNYDNDISNDLLPQGSDAPISLSSSLQDIHNQFGITWIINSANDSLFTYGDEESWSTFYQPNFQPVFEPTFSSGELQQQADAICGSDVFCRFDIAATNRVDIGLTTLQGNIEFETIVNISQPVICDPPCEFGVCVRTDTCSCADGYQGDTCAEIIVGECEENPCENGGTCTFLATSAVCTCPDDFTGLFCEERILFPPGSGVIDTCTVSCLRDIECSFTGRLADSQITSTSNELKCTIIVEGVNQDNFVIDDTFSTEFLSPGSLSFLASIPGGISRDTGFESCAVDGNTLRRPLLEVLGLDTINVVYFNNDLSVGSIDLTMSNIQEVVFGGDFTVELDEANRCSLVYLFNWISQPQPAVDTTCRSIDSDSDSDTTVAFFPISCF